MSSIRITARYTPAQVLLLEHVDCLKRQTWVVLWHLLSGMDENNRSYLSSTSFVQWQPGSIITPKKVVKRLIRAGVLNYEYLGFHNFRDENGEYLGNKNAYYELDKTRFIAMLKMARADPGHY